MSRLTRPTPEAAAISKAASARPPSDKSVHMSIHAVVADEGAVAPLGFQIHRRRVAILAVEHLVEQGRLTEMAGRLPDQNRDMTVAGGAVDNLGAVGQKTDRAYGGGGQDRLPVGFVVE